MKDLFLKVWAKKVGERYTRESALYRAKYGKWSPRRLTMHTGSRKVNCHLLLFFYFIPVPLPINYTNFSHMTTCSKFSLLTE